TDHSRARFPPANTTRTRYALSQHIIGTEPSLILPHEAADAGGLSDARHSSQLVAKVPILKAAQVGQAVAMRTIYQDVFINPAGASCIRPNHRMDLRRKPSANLLHVLEYARARPIHVRAIFKDHIHVRV